MLPQLDAVQFSMPTECKEQGDIWLVKKKALGVQRREIYIALFGVGPVDIDVFLFQQSHDMEQVALLHCNEERLSY